MFSFYFIKELNDDDLCFFLDEEINTMIYNRENNNEYYLILMCFLEHYINEVHDKKRKNILYFYFNKFYNEINY